MADPTARRRYAHIALAAVVCAAAMLYFIPPGRYGFYPRCPFHEATGLLCPGCGATRALAALLHGHLAEALRWNTLVVMLLPPVAVFAIVVYRRAASMRESVWPEVPLPAMYGLLGAALLFGVGRNVM